ncbi:ribonuclease 3-like protein 2 isoform X2 [Rosa rugosa]|uniref:ribonuclease 3-like protein 2 isoform X2 n=1 Tax=Rosa rugosa TaxID=74645 RepID=UPI002B412D8B|nr:ribonuclease 3-like protein 2 isoform X2 [Rosa rugosa]
MSSGKLIWSQIILLSQDKDTLKVVFGLTIFLLILQNFSTRIFCKMNPRSNEKIPTVAPLYLRRPKMKESVEAVERILDYDFKNKRLLEEALTHPSCRISDAAVSYQRLAFLGDTVLDLAVSKYLFLAYPGIHQGDLTELRSANVSTKKFARVAVRHGLYTYLRRTATGVLDDQVREFTEAVRRGEESVEACKVLADIVESVAGAIYVDLNFDLEQLWMKQGKHVSIECRRDKMKSNIDGKCVALGSAEQKEIAKVNAAELALSKLMQSICINDVSVEDIAGIYGFSAVERAKYELHKLCAKKKWPKPIYTIEHEEGPPHDKMYQWRVTIGVVYMTGDAKSTVKDAKNSAASSMIRSLQDPKNVRMKRPRA